MPRVIVCVICRKPLKKWEIPQAITMGGKTERPPGFCDDCRFGRTPSPGEGEPPPPE